MTTKAQLDKAARALPEVQRQDGPPRSYTVHGSTFAALTTDSSAVDLWMAAEDAAEVRQAHPGCTPNREGLHVPLAEVNGMVLNALVARAWRHRAPAQLRRDADSADSGEVTTDLPAIGRPATRALVTAGITDLDQVAARSESELLALHGVGPRAVRILADALADQGRSLT
ncbi:hypothetical protein [Ruania zhangjianzhongii]|uniref:hypothetical protein n=1 Tax=Ruania zhangjianzhongii TaxID=2603206 RepID=UPI0011C8210D|nr:hypothetical protein [Ruania zhangjianzhongii]